MKKLLALALALMLLMASAAFAETANVTVIDNVALLVTSGEESYTIDLSDLTVTLALGTPDETPTIQLDVDDGTQSLLGATIQFADGTMLLGIDGLSRPLAAALTANGAVDATQAQEGLNALFANLDAISSFKLPPVPALPIPKLDLSMVASLLPMLGVEPVTDGAATTFEIPAELISGLVQAVVSQIPAEASAQLGGLDKVLANTEFGLKGRIADDGATSELLLDVYPAEGGVTTDTAVAGLYFASSENSDSLQVLLYQEGQSITLGSIDLASKPEIPELDLSFDVMGQVTLVVSLYPDETGAQVAAMELNAAGETMNASLTYGDKDENEFAEIAFDIPVAQVSASVYCEEAPDGKGGLNANISAMDQLINLTADLAESKADVDFRAIANAENALDVNSMTEADTEALGEEMNQVVSGLMGYLGSITAEPAA